MKSDRRHELQTNVLADWLGERLEAYGPYATQITVGVVVGLMLILGGIWYFAGGDPAAARNWSAYFAAFNEREPAENLRKLAADQPGTKAALWAMQSVGDMNLAQGAGLLFSDRAEAQRRLEEAKNAYEKVEAAATDEPMLLARARLGLAKVYESLCRPEEAAKYYDQVATTAANTAIGKAAAADAKRMKDERQIAMLAWFAEQKPKRPAALPGVGGQTPGLPSNLPESPDIGLPGGVGGNLGTATPREPPLTFPSPDTPPPAPSGDQDAATVVPKSEALPKSETSPEKDRPADEKPADAKAETPKGDGPQ